MDSDADFLRLAKALRSRTRMYVLDDRFATLVAFVDGVDIGSDGRLLHGFNEWIHARLLGYQTNFHWSKVIKCRALGVELDTHLESVDAKDFDRDASLELLERLVEFLEQRSESSAL